MPINVWKLWLTLAPPWVSTPRSGRHAGLSSAILSTWQWCCPYYGLSQPWNTNTDNTGRHSTEADFWPSTAWQSSHRQFYAACWSASAKHLRRKQLSLCRNKPLGMSGLFLGMRSFGKIRGCEAKSNIMQKAANCHQLEVMEVVTFDVQTACYGRRRSGFQICLITVWCCNRHTQRCKASLLPN